ncbi:MAG TPA: aspartyl/asparaginyl beta-hydroxylase domain-containing protein [Sphingomicrobium sp.]|nr:aspartyl/asparaginyl beta-hydroxylase domain-containing protein [Sphingomicrobium sp.]
MRFTRPLLRLPIRFSPEALEHEVRNLPKSAWVAHPNAFPGNDAVRLITTGGEATDALDGSMGPTEYLRACPYILEILAELGATWGRSRLMGLAPGAEVPAHADSHYYWRTHIRVHVPIITNPGVEFTCGGETVHMAAGECWVFDSFQRHEVHNRGNAHRVHLVIDTVGGQGLWELIEAAQGEPPPEPRLFNQGDGAGAPVLFEQVNLPKVMSPWELRCHIAFLQSEAVAHPRLDTVLKRLDRLAFEWGAAWAAYADTDEGVPAFRQLLQELGENLKKLQGHEILMSNGLPLYHVLARLVFEVAIAQPSEAPAQQAPQQVGDHARAARLVS